MTWNSGWYNGNMILICTPTWVSLPSAPGSVQQEASCGHVVWVSTSGVLEMLRHADMRAVCCECLPAGDRVVITSPLVRQELEGLLGKGEAERTIDGINRLYGQ